MSTTLTTPVVVIGAGPVGLFAVFQCGMQGLSCVVVDALDAVGGQCQALYPEKPIYDIPAYPSISGGMLSEKLAQQAAPFNPRYLLGQRVAKLEPCGNAWHVTTDQGTRIEARAVIIAAGAGAFGPNRPPLEGIEAFEASGAVQYYVKKAEAFRGKSVVIAGGGDSAVDWAVILADIAAKVYVVHRRAKFRALPESISKLEVLAAKPKGRVELVTPYQLHRLEGGNGMLGAVVVATLEGAERRLEADHLLAFFGLSMDIGAVAQWGLELEHNHIRVDQGTAATNLSGVYAVGDIATYPHKLKLIATGFAEAAQAAHAAYNHLNPDKPRHFQYSTTQGVPV